MEYQKDTKATPKVGWKLDTIEQLKQAPDLIAAAEYIKSGAEDYLAPFKD